MILRKLCAIMICYAMGHFPFKSMDGVLKKII